jgi:hypothetical protein
MNSKQKVEFVQAVRQAVLEDFPGIHQERCCLYLSFYAIMFLERQGIRAELQAGSMSWRCVSPEHDDGVVANYFSYQWSPRDLPSLIAMATGDLPEMHVWLGIPATQELIDLNTGQFPVFMKRACPQNRWQAPPPPDFLWVKIADAPEWQDVCFYEPNAEAVLTAAKAIQLLVKNNRSVVRKRFGR